MTDEPNLSELMRKLRSGDQQSAAEVFHRYANRLIALARSRLDVDLRRKVDPEDIVQSAFHSFFRRQGAGEISIADWGGLWALLALITVHKCGHRIRYYRAARRDAGQEQSAVRFTEDSAADWEAISREPTPSHAAMLTEAVDDLMQSLDDRERQILVLSLQGHTVQEVSANVERSQRTVRRVLERVRAELERRCDSVA